MSVAMKAIGNEMMTTDLEKNYPKGSSTTTGCPLLFPEENVMLVFSVE